MQSLKETHFLLRDYADFSKATANVEAISVKLHQLNYLIGQENMEAAVCRLWDENPSVFSVLGILIAVRAGDRKKAIDEGGRVFSICDYFHSASQVVEFLNQTGLTEVLQSHKIKNLVDYVFGVEIGLDSNTRKNRGGHIMEHLVANILSRNGIRFEQEINCTRFPDIMRVLGTDNKRFDFVVHTSQKTYLIETNFYTSCGSKLNEVARSYSELAPKINAVPGYEFVWITDGTGWIFARNKLEEAFVHIPSVYNLASIGRFIEILKRQQVEEGSDTL